MTRKLKIEMSQDRLGSDTSRPRHYFRFIKNVKGQTSTLEIAIFVICLVLALVAMQGYIIRSIQGKFRESADSIGMQYDPGNTNVNFVTTSTSLTHTNVLVQVDTYLNTTNATTTVNTINDETSRQGTEIVGYY